jgi:drug/metabolite transporter (DMT)-like permease
MNVLIRALTQAMPVPEVVFFRNFGALVCMTPWIISCGGAGLRTSHHRIYLGRSTIAFVSMLLSFWGLALMPIAEATALGFTSPLFATIAAVIFLGEVCAYRRWTATVIGFIGALIIIRPGFDGPGVAAADDHPLLRHGRVPLGARQSSSRAPNRATRSSPI